MLLPPFCSQTHVTSSQVNIVSVTASLCKELALTNTEGFSVTVFSIPYFIVQQVWLILPPKCFSHLTPVPLRYFTSLSFTWILQGFITHLFLLVSHPFSVLPMRMIQMKCPPHWPISRSAFEPGSNLCELFTALLIIPPTASSGSSNLAIGTAFCLPWRHSFTEFQTLPLATLPLAILVWSGRRQDNEVWIGLLWTVLLLNMPWPANKDLDTSYPELVKLFYAMDAVHLPFPLSKCPSLLSTGRITVQESTHNYSL